MLKINNDIKNESYIYSPLIKSYNIIYEVIYKENP